MEDAMTQCGELVGDQIDEQIDYLRYGFGPDGASIGRQPETIRLALLNMPNGAKIEFWGAPGEDQIGMMQMSGEGDTSPILAQEADLSFLDLYTQLVPKDVPVPEMLLRLAPPTDYEELKRKYPSQEYIEEPIQISDDQFDLVADTPIFRSSSTNSGSWNCAEQGTAEFQSFACSGINTSGTIRWCDASRQFNFRDRWTNSKRKRSLSITAVCNTEIGYVQHWHWFAGNWFKLYDASLPPNRWTSVLWTGISGPGGRRRRWVRHGVLNTPAGAYFRAFTAMY
jgi:hypothetical protein